LERLLEGIGGGWEAITGDAVSSEEAISVISVVVIIVCWMCVAI